MPFDFGDDWVVDEDNPPPTPQWLVRFATVFGGTCAVILAIVMAIDIF